MNRELELSREPCYPSCMVVVLVGNKDRTEIGGRKSKARETRTDLAQPESAIEHYARRAGFDE